MTQIDNLPGDLAGKWTDSTIDIQIDEPYAAQVDAALLEAAASATLALLKAAPAALTLVVTDDMALHTLNRNYRGIDAPTDVLSFAAHDDADAAVDLVIPPELAAEMAAYLGDVVIALPYAARQAAHYGNSLADELGLLTTACSTCLAMTMLRRRKMTPCGPFKLPCCKRWAPAH
jgi:probable rRNA maturation factor